MVYVKMVNNGETGSELGLFELSKFILMGRMATLNQLKKKSLLKASDQSPQQFLEWSTN